MRKSLKASLGVAALAVVSTALFASPANAAPISQGKAGQMNVDVELGSTSLLNLFAPGSTPTPADWVINAPTGVTFTDTTPSVSARNGATAAWTVASNVLASPCAISNAGATLTCTMHGKVNNIAMPANSALRLTPNIAVSPDAPTGQQTNNATVTVTAGFSDGTRSKTFTAASSVTVSPAAPVVSNIDNGSGNTVLTGTGVPGGTVTIKDDQGNVIKTVPVDGNGNWEADLGSNLSGTASDLAVTQTSNGLESDATTVSAADLPVANPMIAGGAAIAAAAALGTVVMIRRKRATA